MSSVASRGVALCPSSRCEEGHLLIGIVGPTGLISLLPDALPVDAEFNRIAHEGRAPEKRFRFASPCEGAACQQWTGSRCGVIDEVMGLMVAEPPPGREPPCAIRARCRWYGQAGPAACQGCAYVVTDRGGAAELDGHPAL